MLSRTQKQLFIGGIYVLVAALIGGGIIYAKYRPTCSDGMQNGKEEGVDCGTLACGMACAAPIKALIIQDTQLAKTPAGDFDMAALIYNPNSSYGSDRVDYNLVISDSAGTEVLRRSDSFYILPGQTKYIVRTSLHGIPDGSSARIEIKNADWIKVATPADIHFIVAREALTGGTNQTAYEAVITNNSNFDFDTVDIGIIVISSSGTVITTNMTNLQTFLSRTDRSVKVTWPFVLPAGARVQTEIGTNIFNNANFLKRNGTQEKFQKYY